MRRSMQSPNGMTPETISSTLTPAEPPKRFSQVARNVMTNWGNFIFSAIVSFFLSPFIVRRLGTSGYGVWTLIVSLTGYMGLLDLGVRGAVTRYVAKHYTRGEHQEVRRIVSSALVIFVSAGALAIIISVVLMLLVMPHFQVPAPYQSTARLVLLITGVNVTVSLIGGVFGGVVIGLQRFDVSNSIEVTNTGLRSLLIVLLLRGGGGIFALAGVQLTFSVLSGLAYAWAAYRLYPELEIRFSAADRQHLAVIFSFSFYSFILQMATSLIYYTDSVVIGAFLPVGAVTFFAIAGNLMNYARAPISSISVTMTPLVSSIEARSDDSELRALTSKACRYATAVMLPVAITFLFRGKPFIAMWMGTEYAELSGQVLSILTIAWLFSAGNAMLSATMFGISKHKALVPAELSEGVCNLGLSLLLVRKMGVVGVAWGTTIPNLGVHLFFWPWYLRRTLGIPITAYVLSTWIRPAAAAMPFAMCTYGVERWFPATSLGVFLLQVVIALPVALIPFWYFVIDSSDRRSLAQNYFPSRLRFLGRI
jgi:O-antigen/teichoic acid export membrane protein